jgi:hypothetical protein
MVLQGIQHKISLLLVSLAGLGATAATAVAQATPPGVYYSWRVLDTSVEQCLDRAANALVNQQLENIQADDSSVAGRSDVATAVFICMDQSAVTTVMVIVSSEDEAAAVRLRESLKTSF